MKLIQSFTLRIFLFALVIPCFGQDIPERPESWLNDYSGTLSQSQQRALDQKLNHLENETSTQIFIAIFDRIPENSYLEDFSVKLFEKWRPGREKEDNGVLIVLFTGDRKVRIETGYGLESVLTDLQTGRIIDDVMIPEFRTGDYYSGLNAGIDAIISAVKGEYKIPVKKKDSKKISLPILVIIAIILSALFKKFTGSSGQTISRTGKRYYRSGWGGPFIFPGGGGSVGGSFFGGSGGGGGFSGGFGGLSGGGGASGSW